jgi:hypothetical protein
VRDLDLSWLENENIDKMLKESAQNGAFCLVESSIEPVVQYFGFTF